MSDRVQCDTGKVGFWTKASARDEMRLLRGSGKGARNGRRLHVFRCDLCGRWHIGSVTAAELQALREQP